MKTDNYNSTYYQWNEEKGSLHNLELVFKTDEFKGT